MKKASIVLALSIFMLAGLWIFLALSYPTTSPLNAIADFIYSKQHPHRSEKKVAIGFLPYWRVTDVQYARLDLLSEINYFSLSIKNDGNFLTVTNGKTDPGWLAWNSKEVKNLIAKTQITGGKFTLTLATQRNKVIESLLDNKPSQNRLIQNILEQVKERHLDGIIIDFEYDGKPDEKYVMAFTEFAKNIQQSLHAQNPKATMGLTLLPLAGREKGLFDLPKLTPFFTRFIGMSYDYYAQSSDIAGPVAPLSGFKENKFFFDVTTTYEDFLKIIPKEKLVMGIPYYGWDWTVENGGNIQSKTLAPTDPNNYSAVLSYARMREDTDLKPSQCQWDSFAQEPWCWYIDKKNTQHQVWYENTQSIGAKYDFMKTKNLEGVAIWTLGYDKNYPDLWTLMENNL